MTSIASFIDQLKTLPQDYKVPLQILNNFLIDIQRDNERNPRDIFIDERDTIERGISMISGTIDDLEYNYLSEEPINIKALELSAKIIERIKECKTNIENLLSQPTNGLSPTSRLLHIELIKEFSVSLNENSKRHRELQKELLRKTL